MNNILVIANATVADKFIDKIINKKVSHLKYTLILKEHRDFNSDVIEQIFTFDATSLYRLKSVCKKDKFSTVFIICDDCLESKAVYDNIRVLNKKVRVVALDTCGVFKEISDVALNIVDSNEIVANRLFDFLPDIPVTAQTIGLNEGEIMEVMVPFSSVFAFRHLSSIPQIKWKIAAIYRDNKLLLPNNATMIRPRDRLLLVGKPQVLINVFNRIKNKGGIFPEPFGKNFYLYLDLDRDKNEAIRYINETIYFLDRFENKNLIIRVVNPNDLKIVEKIKRFEKDNIRAYFSFTQVDEGVIASDINEHDIGLMLLSQNSLKNNGFSTKLYGFKKLIYVFGVNKLSQVKKAVVVKVDEKTTEEISSVAFYIAEALKIKLALADFNPKGDFEEGKKIIEHFETLSQVHSYPVEIIKQKINPISAIRHLSTILLVIPFKKNIDLKSFKSYFNRDVNSLLLRVNKHPKLLIPIEDS